MRGGFVIAADGLTHAPHLRAERILVFQPSGDRDPNLIVAGTGRVNDQRRRADALQLLGCLQVIELDKGDIGSCRPDNDILAGPDILSVRQTQRMSDRSKADKSRQLFTQAIERVVLAPIWLSYDPTVQARSW
jgi:hypothetical protein